MKLLRMFAFRKGIETSKGRISPVQFLILLTLARRKQGTHGYDILRLMRGGFRGRWVPKSGTLYPALDRLVDSDLIEKHEIQRSEMTPSLKDRTFRYSITEKGQEILNEVFNVDEVLERVPDPFIVIGPFWHYVSRHAPPTFQERFRTSMSQRHGLWGRLWARCVLTGQCGTETHQNRDTELQRLETYKQQLQEELETVRKKLKKLRDETKNV
ncbi:MAG: PadR family transcriptional regulator [Candidatus Heimdallarchaeota archaeon]